MDEHRFLPNKTMQVCLFLSAKPWTNCVAANLLVELRIAI